MEKVTKKCPICSSPNRAVELRKVDLFMFCPHEGCSYQSIDGSQTIENFDILFESSNTWEKCETCHRSLVSSNNSIIDNQNNHYDGQLANVSVPRFLANIPDSTNNDDPTLTVSMVNNSTVMVSTSGSLTSRSSVKVASSSVNIPMSPKNVSLSTNIQHLRFPIWPNKDALCWLNSALALLFHSSSVKKYLQQHPNTTSKLCSLLNDYHEILVLVNSNSKLTVSKDFIQKSLMVMQDSAFAFLANKQQCRRGSPDSPIFAIRLFLEECGRILELFSVDHTWMVYCKTCYRNSHIYVNPNKTIISFQTVPESFNPAAPYSYSPCMHCKTALKKSLHFNERAPESLIYHFQEGTHHNDILRYDFQHEGNTYRVKGLIQFTEVKKKKHFITWIRDPINNLWLNCNDLQMKFCQFSSSVPDIKPAEIHLILWERISVSVDVFIPNTLVSNHSTVEENTPDNESPLINGVAVSKKNKFIKPISSDNENCDIKIISEISPISSRKAVGAKIKTLGNHLPSTSDIQVISRKEMTILRNNVCLGNEVSEGQRNDNATTSSDDGQQLQTATLDDRSEDSQRQSSLVISPVPVTSSPTSSFIPPLTMASSLTIKLVEPTPVTTNSLANPPPITPSVTISPVNSIASPLHSSVTLPPLKSPYSNFLSFKQRFASSTASDPMSKSVKYKAAFSPQHEKHFSKSFSFQVKKQLCDLLEKQCNELDCETLSNEEGSEEGNSENETREVEITPKIRKDFRNMVKRKCSLKNKEAILKEEIATRGDKKISQSENEVAISNLEMNNFVVDEKNNSEDCSGANLKSNWENNVSSCNPIIYQVLKPMPSNVEINERIGPEYFQTQVSFLSSPEFSTAKSKGRQQDENKQRNNGKAPWNEDTLLDLKLQEPDRTQLRRSTLRSPKSVLAKEGIAIEKTTWGKSNITSPLKSQQLVTSVKLGLSDSVTKNKRSRKLFIAETKPSEEILIKKQVKNGVQDAQHVSEDSKSFSPEIQDVTENLLQVLSSSGPSITVAKMDRPVERSDIAVSDKKSGESSILTDTKRTYSKSTRVPLMKNTSVKITQIDSETFSDKDVERRTQKSDSPSKSGDLGSPERRTSAEESSLNKSILEGKEGSAMVQTYLPVDGSQQLSKTTGLKQVSPKVIASNQQDDNTLQIPCDPKLCNMQEEEFVVNIIPDVTSPIISYAMASPSADEPIGAASIKKRMRRNSIANDLKTKSGARKQKMLDDVFQHILPTPSSVVSSTEENTLEKILQDPSSSPRTSPKQDASIKQSDLTKLRNRGTTTPTVICLKPALVNEVATNQGKDVFQSCSDFQEISEQENTLRTTAQISDKFFVLSQSASIELTNLTESVVTNANSPKESQINPEDKDVLKDVIDVGIFRNLCSTPEKYANDFVELSNVAGKISETEEDTESGVVEDFKNTANSLPNVKKTANSESILKTARRSSRNKRSTVSLMDFVCQEGSSIKHFTKSNPMKASARKLPLRKNARKRICDLDHIDCDHFVINDKINQVCNTEAISKASTLELPSPKTLKAKGKACDSDKMKQNAEAPSEKSPKKRSEQELLYFRKAEDETVAASAVLTLYSSAKKYERPTLKTPPCSIDGSSSVNSEQKNFTEKEPISNVEDDVSKYSQVNTSIIPDPSILALNETPLLTMPSEENKVSVAPDQPFKQAPILTDKISTCELLKIVLERQSSQNLNHSKNTTMVSDNQVSYPKVRNFAAKASTSCLTDGSEELAGILRAVNDFQSPNISKMEPDYENMASHMKPASEGKIKRKDVSNVKHNTMSKEKEGVTFQASYRGASASSLGSISKEDESANVLETCIVYKTGESESELTATTAALKRRHSQCSPARVESVDSLMANKKVCASEKKVSSSTMLTVCEIDPSKLNKLAHPADDVTAFNHTSQEDAATTDDGSLNHKQILNSVPKMYLIPIPSHLVTIQTKKSLDTEVLPSPSCAPMGNSEVSIPTPTKRKRVAAQKNVKIKTKATKKRQFTAPGNSSVSHFLNESLQKADPNWPENEATSSRRSRSRIRTYSMFSKQPKNKLTIPETKSDLGILRNALIDTKTSEKNQKTMESLPDGEAAEFTEMEHLNVESPMPDVETENTSLRRNSSEEINIDSASTNGEHPQEIYTGVPSPLRHLSKSHIEKLQYIVNERKKSAERRKHESENFEQCHKETQTYDNTERYRNLVSNESKRMDEFREYFAPDNSIDKFIWNHFPSELELSFIPVSTRTHSKTNRATSGSLGRAREVSTNLVRKLDSQKSTDSAIPLNQQPPNMHHKNANRSVRNFVKKRTNNLSVENLPGTSGSKNVSHSPAAKKFKNSVSSSTTICRQNSASNFQHEKIHSSSKCKKISNTATTIYSKRNAAKSACLPKKLQNVRNVNHEQSDHELNPTATKQNVHCSSNVQHMHSNNSMTSDLNSLNKDVQIPQSFNESSGASSVATKMANLKQRLLSKNFSPTITSTPNLELPNNAENPNLPSSAVVSTGTLSRDSSNCEENISLEKLQVPNVKQRLLSKNFSPTITSTPNLELSNNAENPNLPLSAVVSTGTLSQDSSNCKENISLEKLQVANLEQRLLSKNFSPTITSTPNLELPNNAENPNLPSSAMVSTGTLSRHSSNCEEIISLDKLHDTIQNTSKSDTADMSHILLPPSQKDVPQEFETYLDDKSQTAIEQHPSSKPACQKRKVGRPRKNQPKISESADMVSEINDSVKKLSGTRCLSTKKSNPNIEGSIVPIKRKYERKARSKSTDNALELSTKNDESNVHNSDLPSSKSQNFKVTKFTHLPHTQNEEVETLSADSNVGTPSSSDVTANDSTVLCDRSSSSKVRRDTFAYVPPGIDDYLFLPSNISLRNKK